MHTQCVLKYCPTGFASINGIDHFGNHGYAGKLTDSIRRRQNSISLRSTLILKSSCLGPQHQMWKIDVPFMRWYIRALRHVAHVAQITVIDDLPINGLGHRVDFHALGFIDGIEQRRKRVTKIETTTTSVADIENAFHLRQQRRFVVEILRLPVDWMTSGRFETTLALVSRCGQGRRKRPANRLWQ